MFTILLPVPGAADDVVCTRGVEGNRAKAVVRQRLHELGRLGGFGELGLELLAAEDDRIAQRTQDHDLVGGRGDMDVQTLVADDRRHLVLVDERRQAVVERGDAPGQVATPKQQAGRQDGRRRVGDLEGRQRGQRLKEFVRGVVGPPDQHEAAVDAIPRAVERIGHGLDRTAQPRRSSAEHFGRRQAPRACLRSAARFRDRRPWQRPKGGRGVLGAIRSASCRARRRRRG
jgi:hypothetical protein